MISEELYKKHHIFIRLTNYIDFYKNLSFSVLKFITQGTKSFINIDSYAYSSIQGTLESIKEILLKGRINDSYSLLRKYYDSIVINIYSILYLKDNFSISNFVVETIDEWVHGNKKLPEYRKMIEYIRSSDRLSKINTLLYKDTTYKDLRRHCNNHLHYNFFYDMLLNDSKIFLKNRLSTLEEFSKDLENLLILHLAYLFYLNDHYMMSSDYLDCLESGITPEDGSQYYVALFIQEVFDSVINKNRPDIADEIISNTVMKLN
jgi:hypothetical protein